MNTRDPLKALLVDKKDPNEVPIEALHATSVRLMTNFTHAPSETLARAIVRILDALSQHDDRLEGPMGSNVYAEALLAWQSVLHDLQHPNCENMEPSVIH
ncbi:MAG: hypothetical protein AAF384_06045 [Pseudomonadota bacterium]